MGLMLYDSTFFVDLDRERKKGIQGMERGLSSPRPARWKTCAPINVLKLMPFG
jgi:hypothetical protein